MTSKIEEKYKSKSYKHIDHPIKYSKVENYVTNPVKISKHSFLPFIKYIASSEKMIDKPNLELNNRPIKRKDRPLMYAGHLDGYIYKYYSDILNTAYNDYVNYNNIHECSIAYRSFQDDDNKMSNIDSAAEVINFIKEQKEAVIIVGDFTKYFEMIDHELLKRNFCEVLGVRRLSKDWFNIFKSITKYGYYYKNDFDEPSDEVAEYFESKRFMYFKSIKHFRQYKKIRPCLFNKEKRGIPQGSAISASLSNVYAISFDKNMKRITEKYDGIYRRYSDDFLLIIPNVDLTFDVNHVIDEIKTYSMDNKIEINDEKSSILYYSDNQIVDFKYHKLSKLDYLGFVFDGIEVKMRMKSPSKFYRKAKKLINKAHYTKQNKGLTKLPFRRQIYRYFTDASRRGERNGNFITYAKNSQEIFDIKSPKTKNLMMQQISNRRKKISKMLGYRIHF